MACELLSAFWRKTPLALDYRPAPVEIRARRIGSDFGMGPAPHALLAVTLYAGVSGLILLGLAANTVKRRRLARVSIGDGEDPSLIRAMRGQANFVEYAPTGLFLLYLMAVIGTPAWVVHIFGLSFTGARAVHAWHFIQDDAPGWQRFYGTVITFTCIGLAGTGLVAHAIAQMVFP